MQKGWQLLKRRLVSRGTCCIDDILRGWRKHSSQKTRHSSASHMSTWKTDSQILSKSLLHFDVFSPSGWSTVEVIEIDSDKKVVHCKPIIGMEHGAWARTVGMVADSRNLG